MSSSTRHEAIAPTATMTTAAPMVMYQAAPLEPTVVPTTEQQVDQGVVNSADATNVAETTQALRTASLSKSPEVINLSSDQGKNAASTDSEESSSEYAEENPPTIHDSDSDSLSEAESSDKEMNPVKSSSSRAKAPAKKPAKKTADKKVLKRERTNSSSSVAKPQNKRVRTTALQRQAQLQAPTALNKMPLENGEMSNFTSTIFIIRLGTDGRQFHAHESILNRSPKLRAEAAKAKTNLRAAKQNTIVLMAHDAVAFEQMMQYLYNDKFQLSKTKNLPIDRMEEIKELFSLAKHYQLEGLQKKLVQMFASSKLLGKITPLAFFDWAEDMYYEEIDHENGAFKEYFAQIAPALMRTLTPADIKDLHRMVKLGGGFAVELFKATYAACLALATYTVVKVEDEDTDGAYDGSTGENLFVQWYCSFNGITGLITDLYIE